MSTQPDVSIIIPVFNLEKYIGPTLESVIIQDGIKMEVLVVDDNSTDSTKEIVQAYAKKYPFIKLLSNTYGKGVSGARNTAFRHMTGKTCFFLDGDDFLPPNSLQPLFNYLQTNDVPIVRGLFSVLCQQRWLYLKGTIPKNQDSNKYPAGSFVAYLYKSDIIKDNELYFPEDCTVGEDYVFFCQYFCKANLNGKIPVISNEIYLYKINHKISRFSPLHALSFSKYFKKMRSCLEENSKMEYYPSCFEVQFSGLWLIYAYYALQNSSETLHSYLTDCIDIFSGKESELSPMIAKQLNEHTQDFFDACNIQDTQKMFDILDKAKVLQPLNHSYVGIKESYVNFGWPVIKILYRMRSLLSSSNRKELIRIYKFKAKSKKFLASSLDGKNT